MDDFQIKIKPPLPDKVPFDGGTYDWWHNMRGISTGSAAAAAVILRGVVCGLAPFRLALVTTRETVLKIQNFSTYPRNLQYNLYLCKCIKYALQAYFN